MPVVAVLAEHGVLGGEGALVVGALDQHHPPGNVSRGEDVRGAGPQAVVHRHVTALCLYPRGGEVQRVHVAGPADREHHRLRVERARFAVLRVGEPEAPIPFVYPVHAPDAA